MKIKISALTIYPVKSLSGIPVQTSELETRGLKYDRRWMLVTPDGMLLTQRKKPQMALINTTLTNDSLILSKKGKDDLHIPLTLSASDETMSVTIWHDEVKANLVSEESNLWLTDALGFSCYLVYIDDVTMRQCDLDFSQKGDQTGFADAYPLLFISEASLEDLNKHLVKSDLDTVEMRRFRPNVVLTGCDAFAEDTWDKFTLANIPMHGVKLCERCVLTTVDPDKGERTGNEPLMTLAKYRRINNKVCFGQNVIHRELGILTVGDELIVGTV